ncbi:Alpha-glucosidase, glycosyl hydrolase family GH31 [Dyella jiangningensis]|uniref:TIM-barrel domain-containing protein n=2 Tax=Gammaproteobacteria TaxID=1236 RepID=UPI00088B6864|nr:TIM-barrel domain-containing protein [Dyella sp. AtDHG13]PXV59186.1 alpha-glucosidase (family GH31 glycosyl hydrolase) [Dyella sp. AtDHG13]SDK25241.1 Alpha-glucosidase, glycosyl hydrolase family GH31 [Dyella jiangningensis]
MRARLLALALLSALTAAPAALATHSDASADRMELNLPKGRLELRLLAPGIVQLRVDGTREPATPVIDEQASFDPVEVKRETQGEEQILRSSALVARWNPRHAELKVEDASGHLLLSADLSRAAAGRWTLRHAKDDPQYGIGGLNAFDAATGNLLRQGRQIATAGKQGHTGAPFVWSTAGYGVLADAEPARFDLSPTEIRIEAKQPVQTIYLLAGEPGALFAQVRQLSGAAPMFPKWAMGFTNSQWGIDQKEALELVDTYRSKHIPIDNFTFDFDWKAWGEDMGEFRWNNDKFPDGADGKLKQMMDARGMHMTGIMKPRLHVNTVEGREATARGYWLAQSKEAPDYFSHKPVRDVDFDKPEVRAWFFNDALKHSFETGIVGWWNDEADDSGVDTQFLNMQRAMYDGQRAISDQRVWSINRNYYLGAQRYAYGVWSGDIQSGFASMAAQRQRMLAAFDVGAMHWGMDGGGFKAPRPTDENYARWIQFGAFTPVFRVHGDFGQKRQPWVYGPVAEKAATEAIRLRYSLIPYIYSYEYHAHADGVGLVRPLQFAYPNDPAQRDRIDAWMFGDYLLVSPVVEQGQTTKRLRLPQGRWINWFDAKAYDGGQEITLAVDATNWSDIPLFVREGAIIPQQPVMDYVGQQPVTSLDVQVFSSRAETVFDMYDDDGDTYGYEKGAYVLQRLSVQRDAGGVAFKAGAAVGSYKPALHDYVLAFHGERGKAVTAHGKPLPDLGTVDALRASATEGWARGHDRFGEVTYVKLLSGQARDIHIDTAAVQP